MPFSGSEFLRLGLPPHLGPLARELDDFAKGLTSLKEEPGVTSNTIVDAIEGTPGDGQVIKYVAADGRLQWRDDAVGSPGTGEANVQSDWNVTDNTSDAFILNKPTIPDAPANWAKATPTGLGTAGQILSVNTGATALEFINAPSSGEDNVQSNWTETSTTSDAFILNKPTIPAAPATWAQATPSGLGTAGQMLAVNSGATALEFIDAPSGGSGENNVQSDWNVTDNTLDSFIRNKPTIPDAPASWAATGNTSLIPVGKLGSGSAGDNVFLRGNATWAAPSLTGLSQTPGTMGLASQYLAVNAARTAVEWVAAPAGEVNVKSNWNETDSTSDAFIQNKPTLFSGAYSDLTGTPIIPPEPASWAKAVGATGTAPPARLGGGPTGTKVLFGDGTWREPTGGGARQRAEQLHFSARATFSGAAAALNLKSIESERTSVVYGNAPLQMITSTTSGSSFTMADPGIYWYEWRAQVDATAQRSYPGLQIFDSSNVKRAESWSQYLRYTQTDRWILAQGVMVVPTASESMSVVVTKGPSGQDFSVDAGSTLTIYRGTMGARGLGEENVQVDWNVTDTAADAFIKNKPTLFSGAYSDLTGTPTLPPAPADWAKATGATGTAPVARLGTGTASNQTFLRGDGVWGIVDDSRLVFPDPTTGLIRDAVAADWDPTHNTSSVIGWDGSSLQRVVRGVVTGHTATATWTAVADETYLGPSPTEHQQTAANPRWRSAYASDGEVSYPLIYDIYYNLLRRRFRVYARTLESTGDVWSDLVPSGEEVLASAKIRSSVLYDSQDQALSIITANGQRAIYINALGHEELGTVSAFTAAADDEYDYEWASVLHPDTNAAVTDVGAYNFTRIGTTRTGQVSVILRRLSGSVRQENIGQTPWFLEDSEVEAWAKSGDTTLVPTAKLGTGTASGSTFLKGDGTWDSLTGNSFFVPASAITYTSDSELSMTGLDSIQEGDRVIFRYVRPASGATSNAMSLTATGSSWTYHTIKLHDRAGGVTSLTSEMLASHHPLVLYRDVGYWAVVGGLMWEPVTDDIIDARIPSWARKYSPSGTAPTGRLGTGYADGTKVLYGDSTWKDAPSGVGGGTGEANVQANWSETDNTSDAFIRNKPTIPAAPANWAKASPSGLGTAGQMLAVNTSADALEFVDAPSGGGTGEANVQSDWNVTDNTLDSFILNKPTIPDAPANWAKATPSGLGTAGQMLAVNTGATALEFVDAPSGGSGSTTFTGLTDTPASIGSDGQVLGVSGTSLAFFDVGSQAQRVERLNTRVVLSVTNGIEPVQLVATADDRVDIDYGSGTTPEIVTSTTENTFTIAKKGIYLLEWNALIDPAGDRAIPRLDVRDSQNNQIRGSVRGLYQRYSAAGSTTVRAYGVLIITSDSQTCKLVLSNADGYEAANRGFALLSNSWLRIIRGPVGAKGDPGSGEDNVQADWTETNTVSDAYIQNKPTIPIAPATWARVAGATGTAPVARLGTGTPSDTTYLRGDGAWTAFPALFDGTYGSLTGTPTIPAAPASWAKATGATGTAPVARLGTGTAGASKVLYGDGSWKDAPSGGGTGEANVQVNWTETDSTSDAFILNKPTIPAAPANWAKATPSGLGTAGQMLAVNTGATALEFVDAPSGGGGEANVQVDWNVTDNTLDTFIKNKPTIPAAPANWAKASGATGTAPAARLGTGTTGDSVYLRGNSTWGAPSLTSLSQTPGSLGTAGQHLAVNAARTAVEWVAAPAGEANVQANWTETSTTNDAFIKNKPTIPPAPANWAKASSPSGTAPVARLGTGTASNSTFLRGDGTWHGLSGIPGITTYVPSSSQSVFQDWKITITLTNLVDIEGAIIMLRWFHPISSTSPYLDNQVKLVINGGSEVGCKFKKSDGSARVNFTVRDVLDNTVYRMHREASYWFVEGGFSTYPTVEWAEYKNTDEIPSSKLASGGVVGQFLSKTSSGQQWSDWDTLIDDDVIQVTTLPAASTIALDNRDRIYLERPDATKIPVQIAHLTDVNEHMFRWTPGNAGDNGAGTNHGYKPRPNGHGAFTPDANVTELVERHVGTSYHDFIFKVESTGTFPQATPGSVITMYFRKVGTTGSFRVVALEHEIGENYYASNQHSGGLFTSIGTEYEVFFKSGGDSQNFQTRATLPSGTYYDAYPGGVKWVRFVDQDDFEHDTLDIIDPLFPAIDSSDAGKALVVNDSTNAYTFSTSSIKTGAYKDTGTGSGNIPLLGTGGTLASARIPDLAASKITDGTFAAARIPSLNASKINAGTLAVARLGTGTANSTKVLYGDGTWKDAPSMSSNRNADVLTTDYALTTSFSDIGLSATITPSSSSAKILITGCVYYTTATAIASYNVKSGSTVITGTSQLDASDDEDPVSFATIHEPSSTSPQTYTIQAKKGSSDDYWFQKGTYIMVEEV